MTSEGKAHNVLSIASHNINGRIFESSSWGSKDKKPLLAAQGEYMLYEKNDEGIYNYKNKKYNFRKINGTSYAAPSISAYLSLGLKEKKFIFDKGKNNLIAMSALASSTYDKISERLGSQAGLDNRYGAGLFDFSKFFNSLDSLNYFYFYGKDWLNSDYLKNKKNKYSANVGKNINVGTIYAEKNSYVRGTIAWDYFGKLKSILVPEVTYTYPGDIPITTYNREQKQIFELKPKIRDFDLLLYDPNGNLVSKSNSYNLNVEYIKHKTKLSGNHTFKIEQYDNINNNELIDMAFTQTVGND